MERVRYGSNGPRAKSIQKALKAKGFYEGTVNGEFGDRSIRALLEFQEVEFGRNGDDGICGPQTAEALGVDW
jgi:peptidoglycan hydrolase-like protein with peptidoglycan-binding domain